MAKKSGRDALKTAKFVSKMLSDQIESENAKRKYIERRDAYKNSPAGKEEAAKRQVLQDATHEKQALIEEEINELNEVLPVMVEDVKNNIIADLKTVSIQEILKKYKDVFAEIKEKSDRLNSLVKIKYPQYNSSFYATLFYELCDLNAKFILFSPAEVFTSGQKNKSNEGKLPLNDLSIRELSIVYDRILEDDPSISKSEHFKTYYAKYFAEEINNLKNLRDVKSCLTRHPQAFANLNAKLKSQLMVKDELKYTIIATPAIIKFMTKQEIEELAIKDLKTIGSAIMKDPEIADILDERFFERHDYRICFTNFTKAKVKDALQDKIKRHKRLEVYCNVKMQERGKDPSLNY